MAEVAERAGTSSGARFRDGRIPPFSYVTHTALAALHAEFEGQERASAMAMYLALAALSSEERAKGNHGEFEATRADLGDVAGVTPKTIERHTPRFERAGLLAVEHRPGRASIWLLIEPGQVATPSRGGATSSRDHPRHHVATPATSSRDTPDTVSQVTGRARASADEEVKNEEPPPTPRGGATDAPAPPSGGRRRDWDRYREQLRERTGACTLEAGSPPLVAEDEWSKLAPELRGVFGDQFETWLSDAHAHAGGEGQLLIAVPEVAHGWIRDRFSPAIDQVAGRPVEIVVCEGA